VNNFLRRARWSPYLVGALLGLLSVVTFATMGKALGTSTSFVQAVGAAERAVAPEHADANAYLVKTIGTTAKPKPWLEWQLALVLMLPVGAWISARTARSTFRETLPDLWRARFGPSRAKRAAFAFLGGVAVLFGARIADGCTSGHSLSGGLQLAVSSWIFTLSMFAAGIAAAFALYGRRGADHV
jgi:uncharacterized membrane protein YedE/YeeE